MSQPRLYFDNAATSFPKPEAVYHAVDRYQREWGTAIGRGSTRTAQEVQRVIDRCRMRAAKRLGASRPEQVIFTFNGTDALNLAIHGLLRPGDRVVTTLWEHNSVRRPLRAWQSSQDVEVTTVSDDGRGGTELDDFSRELQTPTRLVVITHASNVTGVVQPVPEMARRAREAGALVLLDAAQTAGHLPVSLESLGVDLIACPGHKGLLGPLGTGLLVLRQGVEKELRPVRQGGTGTESESDEQPSELPARLESGNHNAPGLCGLEAALAWWEDRPSEEGKEKQLTAQLIDGFRQLPGVTVAISDSRTERVGVVSISMEHLDPQTLAGLLDSHFHIETRSGLHCAPGAHRALGTLDKGGTVRFSLGPFTTEEHVARVLEAMAEISAAT